MAESQCHILHLPFETLVQVFESLEDIDEVLQFARCCKLVNSVFEYPGIRVTASSPQHEYDVELSKNIAFYGALSDYFYSSTTQDRPRRSRGRGNQFASTFLSSVDCHAKIAPGMIWDIVCRWQGMRLLFDLYCDAAIEAASAATPLSAQLGGAPSSFQAIEENFFRPLPARPCGFWSHAASQRTPKERRQAYRRFYKALTAHWLAVETSWCRLTGAHSEVERFGTAIDSVRVNWMKNLARSLPDKLDVITVVDFVWDFLGRSVSQSRTCFPELDPTEHQGEDPVHGLEFYSLNTLIYARPPDVIELLLAAWDSARRAFDHEGFLHRLGYFDTRTRIYPMQQRISDTMQTNTWLAMTFAEKDPEKAKELEEEATDVLRRWSHYRNAQDDGDARATAFFQNPILETCNWDLGCGHF